MIEHQSLETLRPSKPDLKSVMDTMNLSTYESREVALCYVDDIELQPPERSALNHILPEIEGQPILDIGIGGGRTIPNLIRISSDYIGIDYSSEMVDLCKGKYPDLVLFQADAREMVWFQDNQFQLVVFSYNGIDYVSQEDRLQILSEVYRVLRPGGYFIFSSHNNACRHSAFAFTWNPLKLAVRSLRYVRGIIRHLPKRKYEVITDTYAIRNDMAHDYKLLTYYITMENQCQQLRDCGFEGPIIVYDQHGKVTQKDHSSPWLYYCVSKPSVRDTD